MYTKSELEIIKSVLIQAKKQNNYFNIYEELIKKTSNLIGNECQHTVKSLVDDMLKNSRGFTAEESKMHSEMLKERSTIVGKAYDLNEK